mgnify:CR=1 FL=1
MGAFVFTELTQSPESMQTESACLGVDASNKLTDNDKGKAVKIAASNNFVLCATTEEIEAILVSTEPVTYNDGFAFGTVQRRGRAMATVGANQAGSIAVGDLVVADTQAAIDTAGGLVVRSGSPTTFLWRSIRVVSGTGATGDTVLIERV